MHLLPIAATVFFILTIILLVLLFLYLTRPKEAEKAPFPVGTVLLTLPRSSSLHTEATVTIEDLPKRFDCREKWPGKITEPYHQGECGSCWAFASTTAISDRMRVAQTEETEFSKRFLYRPFVTGKRVEYPVLNNLSPYYLISCDVCKGDNDTECNNGCKGGYIQLVYDYIEKSGVPSLLSSPTECDSNKRYCPCKVVEPLYKPKRVYSVISPGESNETRRRKMMLELQKSGPITTAYMVYKSFYTLFEKSPKGIYREKGRGDTQIGGHAVVIVGWGEENGEFYWLMRNSWGKEWADGGYFRIKWDFEGILDNVMAAEV